MLTELWQLFMSLLSRSGRQARHDAQDARDDFDALTRRNEQQAQAYDRLMEHHLKLAQEMGVEMQRQIDLLKDEVSSLRTELAAERNRRQNEVAAVKKELEVERLEHAQCRQRLTELERKVDKLAKEQDGGN